MSNQKLEVTRELITVKDAMAWLSAVPSYQRKVDERQVKKIAMAIRKGEWRENGATIVFDSKGDLIDGQHRLQAISISGKEVYSLVARGVEESEELFQTIDDSKPRRVSDFIQCKYVTVVAGAARYMWYVNNRQWPPRKGDGGRGGKTGAIPTADLIKVVRKWQKELEEVAKIMYEGNKAENVGRVTGQMSYCAFLMLYYIKVQEYKPKKVAEFFARLGDGVGLEKESPIRAVRNVFLNVSETKRITRYVSQAMILKALNMWLEGKQIQGAMRFEPQREEFPVLYGYEKKP